MCMLLTWLDPNPLLRRAPLFQFSWSTGFCNLSSSWTLKTCTIGETVSKTVEATLLKKMMSLMKRNSQAASPRCTWPAMPAGSAVCWLLLWLRKAGGTQWAACSRAERTSHFTYGKQCGIFCWAFPWKEHFLKSLFRGERSDGHVRIQWSEPSTPASCRWDGLVTAAPISWSETLECSEIMLHICYQTAEKGFVSERQACPAIVSQQLSSCSAWKLLTPKEGVTACEQGPVRLGCERRVCRAGVCSMGTGLEPRRPLSGLPASC